MMVTISVPMNKLRPILRFGFFISPAIKVTLFHASLLKTDPTMAAAMPPINAAPAIGLTAKPAAGLQASFREVLVEAQASVQFADQTSGLNIINPAMIKPNKDSSLV